LQRVYTRDRLIADQRFAGSGVGSSPHQANGEGVATPASTRVQEQQSAAGKHQCPGTTIDERTSEEMICIFSSKCRRSLLTGNANLEPKNDRIFLFL
jgi:hypothetical protein